MASDLPHLPFMKMHGLGNDFVVIDRRARDVPVTTALARAIGNRQRGVGFDQLAVIDSDADADAALTFWNADGSLSSACGNATRCIARYLMGPSGVVHLRTERGLLEARDASDGLTTVNMGAPILDWRTIPLAREMDVDHLPIAGDPVATGMGNPHCTFFVDNAEGVDLATFGPAHEHNPLFPERTNVQVAHLIGPDHLRMRVWERGAGVTLASGSSSCATAVAAHRRGLTSRAVTIELDGGTIVIDWRDDGVWMTGPTAHVFDGVLTPDWLEANT
ncbi:Diaminopimelate epimerase [Rhodobacteraceae bacterium THAF1]|uniref:diaminopimelate epimerase n=1 Tax=Palleronia sp. THAF1 TaxID=2587842 RepID=UPI000F401C7F|nr:diaminopimelate epimerase [Palleronia sp. THAF1]QFU07261.1 Diaminopimelate epimerase [Palleronia sp. THAF1]VDC20827.1 Diaminopimelate epimerase [Rhodobacteraceae bacterium THAF1]